MTCSVAENFKMVDLIAKKRLGKNHSRQEIEYIIQALISGSLPDYQLSAWLMAVCFQGMSFDETAALTQAMANSGQMLDLSALGNVVADKHSTGGVGDKTTLVFAPLMASLGIPLAKLSGRGLGHTGGTIDKLESIDGFNVDLSIEQFIAQVKKVGAAISAQTKDLAPADGKIYAMRDVTSTIESIPLIAASVMSKKIAAGANLILLDVKCGAGAFMSTEDRARELASVMVEIGKLLNRKVIALVTDMEQPLGNAVGHSLEVSEAIDCLSNSGPEDLRELCITLAGPALVQCGIASSLQEAKTKVETCLADGSALAKFREIVQAQGGNVAMVDNPKLMKQALYIESVSPALGKAAYVRHLNGRQIAEACKLLGAGREKKGDAIDLSVGVVVHKKVADQVEPNEAIATIYANSKNALALAKELVLGAYEYVDSPVEKPRFIKAIVS